nr:hypothetical protein Iba_chr14fCG6130 [Ipomoea batatas]
MERICSSQCPHHFVGYLLLGKKPLYIAAQQLLKQSPLDLPSQEPMEGLMLMDLGIYLGITMGFLTFLSSLMKKKKLLDSKLNFWEKPRLHQQFHTWIMLLSTLALVVVILRYLKWPLLMLYSRHYG